MLFVEVKTEDGVNLVQPDGTTYRVVPTKYKPRARKFRLGIDVPSDVRVVRDSQLGCWKDTPPPRSSRTFSLVVAGACVIVTGLTTAVGNENVGLAGAGTLLVLGCFLALAAASGVVAESGRKSGIVEKAQPHRDITQRGTAPEWWCYFADRPKHGSGVFVSPGHRPSEETKEPLDPRFDLRNHSPGFNWGYGGSGPAQLALAICAHCTGDDEIAQRVYQRVKFRLIGSLDDDRWVLTSREVNACIAGVLRDLQEGGEVG